MASEVQVLRSLTFFAHELSELERKSASGNTFINLDISLYRFYCAPFCHYLANRTQKSICILHRFGGVDGWSWYDPKRHPVRVLFSTSCYWKTILADNWHKTPEYTKRISVLLYNQVSQQNSDISMSHSVSASFVFVTLIKR